MEKLSQPVLATNSDIDPDAKKIIKRIAQIRKRWDDKVRLLIGEFNPRPTRTFKNEP